MKRYIFMVSLAMWYCDNHAAPSHIAKMKALRKLAATLKDAMAKERVRESGAPTINVIILSPRSKYAPPQIKQRKVNGLALIKEGEADCYIIMNAELRDKSLAEQSHAILHELAHAYDLDFLATKEIYKQLDLCDPDSERRDIFTYYPHLREDAQECVKKLKAEGDVIAGLKILSFEWYAEWKAFDVMKRIMPKEAAELRDQYERSIGENIGRVESPKYPPLEVMVKWLKQKSE